ncbi:MAG: cache domain-containing protein [Comamonadaceae bacterium]|nr:cache domain-containing protein [Comamonadaceae bacterium]
MYAWTTNVRLFGDTRAIGTGVSAAVRETVLDKGRTWLDRAFVVSDWYVSAYEPLLDGRQRRIGMLYVGFLEEPFVNARWHAFAAVGHVLRAGHGPGRGVCGVFGPARVQAHRAHACHHDGH